MEIDTLSKTPSSLNKVLVLLCSGGRMKREVIGRMTGVWRVVFGVNEIWTWKVQEFTFLLEHSH